MSGTTAGTWSLSGRLARLFLGSTLAFVLVISGLSAIALEREIDDTIDARAEEEAEEMLATFEEHPFDRARFDEQVEEQAIRHKHLPMAWKVWSPSGTSIVEVGLPHLLGVIEAPRAGVRHSLVRLDHGLRTWVLPIEDGTTIAMAMDGSSEYAAMWRFARWTGGAALVCIACALFLASWFSRRVSSLLGAVAQQARDATPSTQPVAITVDGAPVEIRAVVDALHEMLARIRRESEEQRVYLAGMAHELRAPLQNLVGETEVALRQPREAAAYHELLQSNLEELRALGDAIDNLVAISSRPKPVESREREEFDLGEEARIRLLRERAAASREGIAVELDIRGETKVVGDREALMRALRNLVQNAVQWSPQGGRVDVAIAGGPAELEVVVDDAGPGVPDDLRSKIFEPFVRGPSARGRRIGYGLGLALVKRAAVEQGGDVVVERSPRGGARFRVHIPRKR